MRFPNAAFALAFLLVLTTLSFTEAFLGGRTIARVAAVHRKKAAHYDVQVSWLLLLL